ncbi:AAA family ATPase [Planctomycetota bacterium]|nr:AAA family ATPase [Planctomycetota bacterium]
MTTLSTTSSKNQSFDDPKPSFIGDVDKLNRKTCADSLTDLVYSFHNQSKTIAITGPWGCGKSFFVEAWQEQLEKETNTIFFNAWERDYVEEPLLAFIAKLMDLESKSQKFKREVKKASDLLKKETVKVAGKLLSKTAQLTAATGIYAATGGLINGQNVVKNATKFGRRAIQNRHSEIDKIIEQQLLNLQAHDRLVEDFRENLQDYINQLSINDKPVVFIIDELDRCKPDFAIKLLERIKHFFNIKNLVFVIVMDKEQLCHTISHFYGQHFDSERYLNRFVEQYISLPYSNKYFFVKHIVESKTEIGRLMEKCGPMFNTQTFELFEILAQLYGLQPRDIEHIAFEFEVFLKSNIDEINHQTAWAMLRVIVEAKYTKEFCDDIEENIAFKLEEMQSNSAYVYTMIEVCYAMYSSDPSKSLSLTSIGTDTARQIQLEFEDAKNEANDIIKFTNK